MFLLQSPKTGAAHLVFNQNLSAPTANMNWSGTLGLLTLVGAVAARDLWQNEGFGSFPFVDSVLQMRG